MKQLTKRQVLLCSMSNCCKSLRGTAGIRDDGLLESALCCTVSDVWWAKPVPFGAG